MDNNADDIFCYKGNNYTKIKVETLQNDFAQYLQLDNLNFLLGAGCSSNIVDGEETGIPGMKILFESFFEEKTDFRIGSENIKGECNNNLEKLLEIINAVSVVDSFKKIDDRIDLKKLEVQKFILEQIRNGLKSTQVKDIYKGFYSKISQRSRKTPIFVFTTNYDLFSEYALDELGFSYNNGFSGRYNRKFNPISYNYILVDNMNLHRDVWERVPTFFNLVKLHGSISWVNRSGEIWEQDYENINDEETMMIYPTPLKDRSTLMTPYSDLFRTFENRIVQKNSALVVLGYSFSDDHINRLILNGLSIPSFQLVVFGKGENINRLTKLEDPRITVFNSDDNIHYFKNFVDKVLPSIHPDVKEELKNQPVSQLIRSFNEEKL